jgi:hypothetical protein
VVNVQEEPVNPLSSPALPNEFWNFPIQAPNWGWSSLAGDWLGGSSYDATGNFNPYTMAPTTAHIMWTQQTDFGGQPGGPIPGDLEHNFVTTAILVSTWSGIIMQGRLYYNEYNTMGRLTSWKCIDLRTGELIWERDPGIGPAESGTESVAGQSTAESLLRGSVYAQRSMQEYGSTALLYSQCPDRTTWRLYSAFDGTYLGNITGVPRRGSFIRDQNTANPNVGQQLGYEISDGNLLMWNETLCFAGGVTTGAGPYTLRIPTTMPYSAGYQWNVTIPTTYQGKVISPALSIAEVTQDVILLRSAPTLSTQSSAGSEIDAAYNARTGDLMWIKNNTVPFQHSLSLAGAHDDVYVIIDKDALAAYGYSMSTGNQLWGPTEFPGNALSHVAISSDVAYGQIYIFDIGGYCRAINITSGELAWTYYPPSSEYNTPYGVYPIWTQSCQAIADGMIFLGVGRLYDPPLFMNATRIALNCTTGELVWGALGFMSKGVSPVGDGFLVAWDCYDATLYAFSKGPTEITASVQNSVTSLGNSVLITGRVTDVSPGTQQSVQKYNFPDGVPCVPDSEMTDWMAYVYKQQPIPTDVTGVPVTISVLDANNNCYEIGTTTTDAAANGFYSFQWTPEIPGKYTVYATYGGSESYWSSSTETAFVVDDVAATQPPAEYPVPMDYTISIIGAAIAMIIAVAIATILILRKR